MDPAPKGRMAKEEKERLVIQQGIVYRKNMLGTGRIGTAVH